MINEGKNPEWLERAFDACYAMPWSYTLRNALGGVVRGHSVKEGDPLGKQLESVREYEASIPSDALMFCFMDNHDTAADDWERRFDRVHSV